MVECRMPQLEINYWPRRMLALAVAALMAIVPAAAQLSFPRQAITIIVPFSAGGAVDTLARLLADGLSERVGQKVLVVDKPGGGGAVGLNALLGQKADGYTLLLGSGGSVTTLPLTTSGLGYDTLKDFKILTRLTEAGILIAGKANAPARDAASLIELANTQPGSLTMGIAGTSNTTGLALLRAASGAQFTEIPYPGEAEIIRALLGGFLDYGLMTTASGRVQTDADKLLPIAVTTRARLPSLPDVPALAEVVPGWQATYWYGVFVRSETPTAVADRLYEEITAVVKSYAPLRDWLVRNDYAIVATTSAEAEIGWKNDYATKARVVSSLGLSPN